jgi:hypothetical protein
MTRTKLLAITLFLSGITRAQLLTVATGNMKKLSLIIAFLTSCIFNSYAQANLYGSAGSIITVQSGAILYVNGDFTVESTGSLTNAGTVIIERTGTNTANFTDNKLAPHSYGNGLFVFPGSGGTQTMKGSVFYDLQINNVSGVTMLGSQTVSNSLLLTNGSLSIGANTLTLNGPVSGSGKLKGSSVSVLTIGGAAGTLNFEQTSAATRSLNDLTLNTGATAVLGNALDVYGTIGLTSASLNLNAQNLTLKSNSANTARIANLTGSTLSGATNVTMERYIKLRSPGTGDGIGNNGRAYRLLAPTVNTAGSIKANWMEGGMNTAIGTNINPVANFGTQITGSGGNVNGFDVTASNSSSLYNAANAVTPTYSTVGSTAGTLNALTGYFLYLRGDRSMNMQVPLGANMPTSHTTLRTTGMLVTGTVNSFTNSFTGGGALNLVTNPYPSPIDWSLVQPACTNVTTSYTLWDPNFGTRGGFVTVTTGGVASSGSATQFIQPGQAFFVESSGGISTVSIQESHKSAGNNNMVFIVNAPPVESFRTELYFNEPNSFRRIADGVVAIYDNNYSAAVDSNDAKEINNWDENIAIAREGKHLAIEQRPVIATRDTLPLFMNNMKQQAYEFEFTPSVFTNIGLKAELLDNYLGTRTLLSVTSAVVVPFTVTADSGSFANNRFIVLFGPSTTLPIDIITIKAQAKNLPAGQGGKGVQVEWTTRTETDMDRYEVERANDAMQFSRHNTNAATGNNNLPVNYSWLDAAPEQGNNFYRIKAIGKSGGIKYSSIVKVTIGNAKPSISVAPNLVTNNEIALQLTNLNKGTYTLILYNNLGQKIYSTPLKHSGGSANKNITLSMNISTGTYRLVLIGEYNDGLTTTIIKN